MHRDLGALPLRLRLWQEAEPDVDRLLTRGTPDAWRLEAMRKVIPFCGTGQVMYGTDATPGSLAQYAPEHIRKDRDILTNEIGVSGEQLEQFFWGAAEALFA